MITDKPLKLSQVAERLLWLDGKPFSLNEYPMFRTIYDGRYKSTLLFCSRQCGKSTSLANFILSECVAIPFFKSYYVSPSKEQTLIFSNSRVGKTISYSPLLQKHFQSPEHADRVLHRSFKNGSEAAFTYACDDPDRARGFSADRVNFDEVQDILYDAVIPVVNSCMKNSKYRFQTYCGTPKTMEASIQYLWDRSSQSEWVMKCPKCSKHSFIASEKALGNHGPICINCGGPLNPISGFWVDMKKPELNPKTGKEEQLIKGFHVNAPIMPANVAACYPQDTQKQADAQGRWDDILNDLRMFSASKFRNEVLGVSDATGKRLISLEELQALCTGPSVSVSPIPGANTAGVTFTVAGVDWSGGGTSGVSRTVLWIWGWVPHEQKLRTLYYRIYPGNNATVDVASIVQVCLNYQVSQVVGDAGEGMLPNSMLREAIGPHRCAQVMYGSFTKPLTFAVDRFQADRTTMIDNYLMFLKRKAAILPPYAESRPAIDDILNIFEEVTTSGKKVWRHSPTLPDDCLHAQLFGWLAFKIVSMDLKFYS